MRQNPESRLKAFTLIELLIVIAIIAILAAILFPVFAQARAKARQTVCMSNEKQIAFAILMYNQDYDERWIDTCAGYNAFNTSDCGYLPQWTLPKNSPSVLDQQFLIKPYIKNTDVLACPNLHRARINNVSGLYPNYALNELDSEKVNFLGHTPPDYNSRTGAMWSAGPFGRLNAQLTHPATLIMIWEHNTTAVRCNIWAASEPGHWDASHHNGFNAAFADGHVKRWSLGQLTNQLVCYWDLPK